MTELTNGEIRARLEERIRSVLLKHGGSAKRRELQNSSQDARWTAHEFHAVMDDLQRRGVLQITPGTTIVTLLDRRDPIRFPYANRGRRVPNRVHVRENPVDRGAWAQRAATWDRTGGKCWYCGRQTNPFRDLQIDRLQPTPSGQEDELENLVPCCSGCLYAKGSRSLDAFRALFPLGHRFWFESDAGEGSG